ncbi:MAG: cytochrome c3 family protein [Phycisphaerales bacterium]|nr:cytochrome c3 family protein [Phycisphaerales bacterium]
MRDIWPLSERFDLRYVRRRRFPDSWTERLAVVVVVAIAAFTLYSGFSGDQRAFSSGPLTHAHAMFADDCQQCHQPDPARSGFWLPAQDSACLRCHVATLHNPHQAFFRGPEMLVSSRARPVEMSGDCSTCHVEHRGPNVRLANVPDLLCIGCHKDLAALGRRIPDAAATTEPPHGDAP